MARHGPRALAICLLGVLPTACVDDAPPSTSSTGSATSSTSSTATADTVADSTAADTFIEPDGTCSGVVCADDEYCDWHQNSCGALASDQGTCVERPGACTADWNDMCGCDGQLHGSACSAASLGTDVDVLGGCSTPEGMFRCGYLFCEQGLEYCRNVLSNIDGEPDHYSCHLPNPPCEPLTCECLAEDICLEIGRCTPSEDGGFVVTCSGI